MSSSLLSATISTSFSRQALAVSCWAAGTSATWNLPPASSPYTWALPETRSTIPLKAFSSPTGTAIGSTERPNAAWTFSSARSNEAFSRSIRLTTTSRARPYSSAKPHTFSVCTSTPATASTTTMAASATRRAARASERKFA